MRRAFFVFVLALSICFQGIALGGQVVARDLGESAAHALMHAEAVPHHHHAGTIHKDLSKKSMRHVQGDCCACVAFIAPSALGAAQAVPARAIAQAEPRGHDSAFIEGLKRPPRASA